MKKKLKPVKANTDEGMYKVFLNDESVDIIPQWAMNIMSDRLSRVVSLHFAQHPDEYERFLRSKSSDALIGEGIKKQVQ